MTDVEQQLRDEMRTAAENIEPDSIRPLRVPAPRRRSRTVRWLAPVAAAATVAGLIAGLTVAGHNAPTQPTGRAVESGFPKYYVTITTPPGRGVRAVVRASATGAAISSVQLERSQPRAVGQWTFDITGAASDRAFLITTQKSFEILRIAPDGHVLGLKRLPESIWNLSGFGQTGGDVLSPDGTEIVMPLGDTIIPTGPGTARECASCARGLAMYSVTTGVIKKWLVPKSYPGVFQPVNWPGHGHEVFVNYGANDSYCLFNVASPGGSLLANCRRIRVPLPPHGWDTTGSWMLPGQKALLAAYLQRPGHGSAGRIVEISIRTGRVTRVLYTYSTGTRLISLGCVPGSLGPSGVHALMGCVDGRYGRLDGSHFTPLPGLSKDLLPVAAW